MLTITGCGETDANVIPENGSLIIPLNEVTETAKFYPVKIDGTDGNHRSKGQLGKYKNGVQYLSVVL